MSTVSPNLSLPYIQQNQAQKHVTHNLKAYTTAPPLHFMICGGLKMGKLPSIGMLFKQFQKNLPTTTACSNITTRLPAIKSR